MMNDEELLRNADFLSIALEEMDEDSAEYGFVSDVCTNLVEAAEE